MTSSRNLTALGTILVPLIIVLAAHPFSAPAQPTPNPPGQISYQGFLVDANGIPLATNAPKNYDIILRIYNQPTGPTNSPLWAELQTVTVDRGYFSVMLGQGSSVGQPFTNNLTSVFIGSDASDRYVGTTVRGLAGGDVEIAPRLRLQASPYSFLAATANNAVKLGGYDWSAFFNSTNPTTGSIPGSRIQASSITSAQITNGAIGSVQIANGAVGTSQIASGAVGATQIAANAVMTVAIADGAVTSAKIATPLGIGTASPQAALHVRGADGSQFILQNSADNSYWYFSDDRNDNLVFQPNTGVGAYIDRAGNYHNNSDIRLKRDITPLTGVLDRVLQLQPVSYHFRSAPEGTPPTLGLIAQEVEPLFPEVVGERAGIKSLAYTELVPVTIRAVQELNQKLEEQGAENAELKRSVTELKELVSKLAAQK